MDFETYLNDLPLLHTWDLGKTWNTGGLQAWQLKRMHKIVSGRFPGPVRILETGAGNSTITFLHLAHLDRLVTIAPAADLRDRVLTYCDTNGINTAGLDFRLERSEIELPGIALGAGGAASRTRSPRSTSS